MLYVQIFLGAFLITMETNEIKFNIMQINYRLQRVSFSHEIPALVFYKIFIFTNLQLRIFIKRKHQEE